MIEIISDEKKDEIMRSSAKSLPVSSFDRKIPVPELHKKFYVPIEKLINEINRVINEGNTTTVTIQEILNELDSNANIVMLEVGDAKLTADNASDVAFRAEDTAIQADNRSYEALGVAQGIDHKAQTALDTSAEVKLLAEGSKRAVVFSTYAEMVAYISNSENAEKLVIGDNLYIEDTDSEDYWISNKLSTPNAQGWYYELGVLGNEKVDLSNVVKTNTNQTVVGDKDFTGALKKDGVNVATVNQLAAKVDKIAGKGLSTYDYAFSDKSKVDAAEEDRHTHNNKQLLDNYTVENIDIEHAVNRMHIHENILFLNDTTASYTLEKDMKLNNIEEGAQVNKQNNEYELSGLGEKSFNSLDDIPNTLEGYGIVDALNINLKGANSGLAELDSSGKVPSAQLPSYVDDVLEYAALTAFPTTGESGKIYVAIDSNLSYRWAGSGYVEISPSIALGETSSTAYRGDRGAAAYLHISSINNPHSVTKAQVGLGNVDNTADADKPISSAAQAALNNKADKATTLTGYGITDALNINLKGANNGLAELGGDGKVPSSQLPTTSSAVTSVSGRTGAVVLTKTDVGLGNVINEEQATKTEFNTHNTDSTKHITSGERTSWNNKAGQPYIQRTYSAGNGARLIGVYNYSTSVGDTRPLFYMEGKQGHGNGSSYLWQGEFIFGVNTNGVVTAKSILTVSDGTFGKLYYRHDTANKILYIYIYTGQYSSAYFSDLVQINAGNYSSYFTLSAPSNVTTDTIVEGVNILYPVSSGTLALTNQTVDLTSAQTITGTKTFSTINVSEINLLV